MKKRTRRLIFKVITFFQIFSLALQPLSLLSLLILDPVVARAESEVQVEVEVEQQDLNLSFDQEKNILELRMETGRYEDEDADLNLTYSLSYVDDDSEEKIEQAVMGQLGEIEEDVYGADIYLGTCSSDGCSDDPFNKGSLQIGEDYQSDFIFEDDEIWFKQNDGHKYITGSDVELGKKYVAPQNSDVTVTFSELPEKTSPLSIEEITLTEEEIQATGAISDKAYDITTEMEDGSFKFDLTLPSTDETTEVVYVEERADILTGVRGVEQEVVKEQDVVKVKDLDHLTIWIATYSNPALFEITEMDENSDRIRICHRTKSHANPYIVNNPSKSGDVSGHAYHGLDGEVWFKGITVEWGDIIPPFYYGDGQTYPGKNWSTEGEAIWKNNCEAGIDEDTLVVHKLYEDETNGFVSGDYNNDFTWRLDENEFYPFGETVDRPDTNFTIYETMPKEYELRGWFYGDNGDCLDNYATGNTVDIEVKSGDEDLEITICNQLVKEILVYCGDGNVNAQNEQCDDGNKNDEDYCNNQCQFNNVCLPDVNMLVNGGFEEPEVINDYKWDIFNKFSPMLGWAVEWSGGSNTYSGETRPEPAFLELHRGVNGWLPKSGDQYAELDTDWDGPGQPLNNEPAIVRISQNIPIIDGYKYKVGFSYSPRPGQGVANNSMDFELDGSMVNNYSASGSENTNWTPVSYEFTADEDAIRTVSFVERGTVDSLGMFIDDVSVYCLGKEVPECVEEGLVWADEVEDSITGSLYSGNTITDPIRIDPQATLGEADGNFYSLGKDGQITLNFYYYIANVSGVDLSIHEITWNRSSDIEETAEVWVKNDFTDWIYLGEASSFSDGNGDTIPDGINYFDLSSVKLPWINAVKLIESSQGQAGYDDGFDLDAIDATKRVCEEPVIEYGSIQGRKYHDLNLNGSFDNFEKNETGDPNRLDGWKINLFDDQWNLIDSMNTGDDSTTAGNVGKGQYKFVNLFAGRYYVCEEQKEGWYQTEPSSGPKYENEGPYCHVIDVVPGQNVNTIQFGNYQGSDLEICKVDNKNRPQNGWEVVLASEKVDGPRSINVSDNTGTNSTSLPAGKYLIKVTGTYQYGNTSMIADAGFSYRPLSIPSGCNCWLSGFDLSGGSKGLMAWVNETPVNWGAYNDGHSYTYVYDHSSEGPINISIWDNYYDDNLNNNFQFEIYEIPENYYGITEDDGCVSFDGVAFGDYILDESLKENWINLSGKGSLVKIDSLEESFTLKNRIDAPVEIVATKIVCDLEGYLPNYGSGGPNITSTTAQNWVSESEGHCWLEPDWSFQWGNQAASTPVNDYAEAIGWNTFGPTDSNGQTRVEINNLDGVNQIKVREVLKENYIPFTYPDNRDNFSAEIYCHTDVLNYDNDDRFTPEYGQTYYCVAWNTVLRSDVHGYKWEDLNGNGERDCIVEENNLDETSAEERQVCELEPLLSGWTINLYRSNGEGGFELSPFKSMLTDSSQDDLGWYWFEDLLPGQYKICESNQGDWIQSFPKNEENNCHIVNLPDDNLNGYPVTTNYLEYPEPEYNFGNYLPESQLYIEKSNNVWPTDQSIGNEVIYTIRLMAVDGPVYDVSLFDLPPNAFSYVADSYTANSSVRGDLITSIPEPTYASPGEWQLGDLAKDEIITLTYKAIIGDEADAGIYPDMAWAIGTSAQAQNLKEEGADLLALSDPDLEAPDGFYAEEGHYGEEHFVGTQVAIVLDETPADKYKVEKIEEVEGQVLGASTGLPATGARFWLSILALLSMLTGAGLLLLPNRSKRRQGKALLILLMLGLGLFMAKPVQALTSVRIAQPYNTSAEMDQDAMTSQDEFRIDFVILNTDNLSLDAQCQQQGDGGAWLDIDTVYVVKAGGNSGYCQAEDLRDDSQYLFRVVASDGSETKISDTVKVGLETDRPEKPTNYDKDEIGSCEYEIEFKTADDGRTTRVEVYRSDDNESFTAKASSRIKSITIGSDEEYSFETTKPDCDKDYYYAIRAFDEYGNASDLVGDREIKTVIIEGTSGETEEVSLGALPVTETVVLGEGEIGEGLSTKGTEAGALAEGLSAEEIGEEEGGKILGVKTESIMSFLTRVGLPILVGGTVLFLLYRLFFAKRHEK